jgi:hypothetical protein
MQTGCRRSQRSRQHLQGRTPAAGKLVLGLLCGAWPAPLIGLRNGTLQSIHESKVAGGVIMVASSDASAFCLSCDLKHFSYDALKDTALVFEEEVVPGLRGFRLLILFWRSLANLVHASAAACTASWICLVARPEYSAILAAASALRMKAVRTASGVISSSRILARCRRWRSASVMAVFPIGGRPMLPSIVS